MHLLITIIINYKKNMKKFEKLKDAGNVLLRMKCKDLGYYMY